MQEMEGEATEEKIMFLSLQFFQFQGSQLLGQELAASMPGNAKVSLVPLAEKCFGI